MSTTNELLEIETAFLRIPQVKSALNLTAINKAKKSIDTAKKSRFKHTLTMSEMVVSSVAWFESEEGKAVFSEEGIQWSKADFGLKVFGWQKSFFYKLIKCGGLDARIPRAFEVKCDAVGEDAKRSLEELLKFSRAVDLDSLEHGEDATEEEILLAEDEAIEGASVESNAVKCIFTMTYKRDEGNVSVRVNEEMKLSTTNSNEEIQQAIDFLKSQLSN
jgi:hypothetical protein